MTNMLGRILGEDIALQVNYLSQRALIEADPSMVEQVILNLVVNARDAMPQGGLLTIRIATTEVGGDTASRRPDLRAGNFICLSVSDRGCGIPPHDLGRIFEPFFTTKEVGKGTGLGLATVYGIVKQHQGWIEVASEASKGTSFQVFFPAGSEPVLARAAETTPDAVIRGGQETILVVEDET